MMEAMVCDQVIKGIMTLLVSSLSSLGEASYHFVRSPKQPWERHPG